MKQKQQQLLDQYLASCEEENEGAIMVAYKKGQRDMLEKVCSWLCANLGAPEGMPQAKSHNEALVELTSELRKGVKGDNNG